MQQLNSQDEKKLKLKTAFVFRLILKWNEISLVTNLNVDTAMKGQFKDLNKFKKTRFTSSRDHEQSEFMIIYFNFLLNSVFHFFLIFTALSSRLIIDH